MRIRLQWICIVVAAIAVACATPPPRQVTWGAKKGGAWSTSWGLAFDALPLEVSEDKQRLEIRAETPEGGTVRIVAAQRSHLRPDDTMPWDDRGVTETNLLGLPAQRASGPRSVDLRAEIGDRCLLFVHVAARQPASLDALRDNVLANLRPINYVASQCFTPPPPCVIPERATVIPAAVSELALSGGSFLVTLDKGTAAGIARGWQVMLKGAPDPNAHCGIIKKVSERESLFSYKPNGTCFLDWGIKDVLVFAPP